MKAYTLVLFTFFVGQAALAGTKVDVNCASPKGFAGTAATITGQLDVAASGETSGALNIFIGGSTAKPIFSSEDVKVHGGQIGDGSIHLSATDISEMPGIHIYSDQKDSDLSYVEYSGVFYKTDCSQ